MLSRLNSSANSDEPKLFDCFQSGDEVSFAFSILSLNKSETGNFCLGFNFGMKKFHVMFDPPRLFLDNEDHGYIHCDWRPKDLLEGDTVGVVLSHKKFILLVNKRPQIVFSLEREARDIVHLYSQKRNVQGFVFPGFVSSFSVCENRPSLPVKDRRDIVSVRLINLRESSLCFSPDIQISEFPVVLGREASEGILLPDPISHPQLFSRTHALLETRTFCDLSGHPTNVALIVSDQKSVNGTFINGRRLFRGCDLELYDGDRLELAYTGSHMYGMSWLVRIERLNVT